MDLAGNQRVFNLEAIGPLAVVATKPSQVIFGVGSNSENQRYKIPTEEVSVFNSRLRVGPVALKIGLSAACTG